MTYMERVLEAVRDEEWQRFRKSLRGMDTVSKLNNLKEYWEQQVHDASHLHVEDDSRASILCPICIRVDNYLKALARGGQLLAGVSLRQALAWDWNFKVLK
jgi:hypothetical protein